MRKSIIILASLAMTGCATIPNHNVTTTVNAEPAVSRQDNISDLFKSLLVIAVVGYAVNEVADSNRNKQCSNNQLIYQGFGTKRYYVCK